MANFSYAQYQEAVARAQASSNSSNGPKVGFFKLKDDGDEALIRINLDSVEGLDFASVHTISTDGKWMKVSCLNPLGTFGDNCPLCNASNNNKAISKASKKVYLQMLVAYRDKTTGQFTAAQPVIWERPAAFSRDIATLIRDYGSLKNIILKVTRNGAAGDMKTTYSIGYVPILDKPELVPADGLAAFDNFNIARHSYWEKSAADVNTFLTTGQFPDTRTNVTESATASVAAPVQNMVAPAYTAPATPFNAPAAVPGVTNPAVVPAAPQFVPGITTTPYVAPATQPAAPVTAPVANPVVNPVVNPAANPVAPAAAPASPVTGAPARNFGGFTF